MHRPTTVHVYGLVHRQINFGQVSILDTPFMRVPQDQLFEYFQSHRQKFRRCLEPNGACERHPINAHSIQKSKVLDAIAERGHVVQPQLHRNASGPPIVEWKQIGRNKATTFPGFCSFHDNLIFGPIEHSPFDPSNTQHLFLMAYRSVTREVHAISEAAIQMQCAYLDRVQRGASPKDRPDWAGIQATGWIMNAYYTHEYKKHFDRSYLSTFYDNICYECIRLCDTPPTIAASCLFSLDSLPHSDDVARIVLNVVPSTNITHVLFAFLKSDEMIARGYLARLLCARGTYQKYLISKMLVANCENFAIAPSFFDSFSASRRERFEALFEQSIRGDVDDIDDESLFLFR